MYRSSKHFRRAGKKEYYEAAARQGNDDAQFNLGTLYVNCQGVEQSFETAFMSGGRNQQSKQRRMPSNISKNLTNTKEEQHPPSYHPNDAPPATLPRHPPTN